MVDPQREDAVPVRNGERSLEALSARRGSTALERDPQMWVEHGELELQILRPFSCIRLDFDLVVLLRDNGDQYGRRRASGILMGTEID